MCSRDVIKFSNNNNNNDKKTKELFKVLSSSDIRDSDLYLFTTFQIISILNWFGNYRISNFGVMVVRDIKLRSLAKILIL